MKKVNVIARDVVVKGECDSEVVVDVKVTAMSQENFKERIKTIPRYFPYLEKYYVMEIPSLLKKGERVYIPIEEYTNSNCSSCFGCPAFYKRKLLKEKLFTKAEFIKEFPDFWGTSLCLELQIPDECFS